MGSIALAALCFTAACAFAYAEELEDLYRWLRPAVPPPRPRPAPRAVEAEPPKSMLRALVRDLESPDPRRRERAFDRLPQFAPRQLTQALVPMLRGPVDETRDRIADLLLRHGGEGVLEPLHQYFLERDDAEAVTPGELKAFPVAQARGRAAAASGGVVVSLRDRRPLSGPGPVLVPAAVSGPQLGDIAFPDEVLNPDPSLRARAISDLSTSGHPHAHELLCRVVVADPDALVRGVAAAGIGRLPPQAGGLDALAEATRDADPAVRWNACFALGKLGDTAAKRALRFAENDADGSVRLAARKALEALGLDPPLEVLDGLS